MVRMRPTVNEWKIIHSRSGELVTIVGGRADRLTRLQAVNLLKRLMPSG